jgi:hypothetical protein
LTLDQYERHDIYNMDEIGLFYRMQVSAAWYYMPTAKPLTYFH